MATLRTAALSLLLLTTSAYAQSLSSTDIDILNFALNLEYLGKTPVPSHTFPPSQTDPPTHHHPPFSHIEAEFYSWAAFGTGLPADLRGGGPPAVGGKKALLSPQVQAYAEEIATDEINHVKLLRRVLGSNAVPQPSIDIGDAFATAANAAFNATLPVEFDPYASDVLFLHGMCMFIGVC